MLQISVTGFRSLLDTASAKQRPTVAFRAVTVGGPERAAARSRRRVGGHRRPGRTSAPVPAAASRPSVSASVAGPADASISQRSRSRARLGVGRRLDAVLIVDDRPADPASCRATTTATSVRRLRLARTKSRIIRTASPRCESAAPAGPGSSCSSSPAMSPRALDFVWSGREPRLLEGPQTPRYHVDAWM